MVSNLPTDSAINLSYRFFIFFHNEYSSTLIDFFSQKVYISIMKEAILKKQEKQEVRGASILDFITPIIYLLCWIILLGLGKFLLGEVIVGNSVFIISSLAILFIGIIAKSSSWSIGGNNGIKADTLGKYLEFHSGGNPPWDYKIYIQDENESINKLKESEEIVENINMKVVKNESKKTSLK